MAQLSRPYQIAIVALLVAAIAWFAVGLHHGSPSESTTTTTTSTTSQPSATSTAPAAGATTSTGSSSSTLAGEEAKKAAAPSSIYHGSAPGVQGLSRAVAKAHEAVATSQSNAKHLEEKSAQASGEASSSGSSASAAKSTPAASAGSSTTSTATTTSRPSSAGTRTPAKPKPASSASSSAAESGIPSGQREVELALAQGKIPVVLFWNPAGADDVAVHGQVLQLGRSHLPIAVYEGNPEAVASFGAITREIPVYGTPTILVIAKNGQTTELTGLQEDFSIEQAIEQARRAPKPPS